MGGRCEQDVRHHLFTRLKNNCCGSVLTCLIFQSGSNQTMWSPKEESLKGKQSPRKSPCNGSYSRDQAIVNIWVWIGLLQFTSCYLRTSFYFMSYIKRIGILRHNCYTLQRETDSRFLRIWDEVWKVFWKSIMLEPPAMAAYLVSRNKLSIRELTNRTTSVPVTYSFRGQRKLGDWAIITMKVQTSMNCNSLRRQGEMVYFIIS